MRIEQLSKRDVVMLNRCLSVAENSTLKQKHGALVYKAGRVLGVGFNKMRNEHPTMEVALEHYTVHAELDAMGGISEADLRGATIYIARIGRSAPSLLSAPCPNCLQAIEAVGIKRVVTTI